MKTLTESLRLNSGKIPGGKGERTKPVDVNKNELAVSVLVEKEHAKDLSIAQEVAIDHLTENPTYYSDLIKTGIVDEKEALKKYEELFNDDPTKYTKKQNENRAFVSLTQAVNEGLAQPEFGHYIGKVIEEGKCPKSGCIDKKPNGKWGVISNKTGKFWPQDYDSKGDAEDALQAYHANK